MGRCQCCWRDTETGVRRQRRVAATSRGAPFVGTSPHPRRRPFGTNGREAAQRRVRGVAGEVGRAVQQLCRIPAWRRRHFSVFDGTTPSKRGSGVTAAGLAVLAQEPAARFHLWLQYRPGTSGYEHAIRLVPADREASDWPSTGGTGRRLPGRPFSPTPIRR